MNHTTHKLFQISFQVQNNIFHKPHNGFVCVGAYRYIPLQGNLQKIGSHGEFKNVANNNAIVLLFTMTARTRVPCPYSHSQPTMKGSVC